MKNYSLYILRNIKQQIIMRVGGTNNPHKFLNSGDYSCFERICCNSNSNITQGSITRIGAS